MEPEDKPRTKQLQELYGSFDTFRLIFQILLALLVGAYVAYVFSIFTLNDDSLNAQPLPEALTTLLCWAFAFAGTAALFILYMQFAFSLNRRSCMGPMYWIFFVIYIIVLVADVVYLIYEWLANCTGAVDLVMDPQLGYCSTGTEVRWQFHFSLWLIVAMMALFIANSFVLNKLFMLAKRIKPYIDGPVVPGEPVANTVRSSEQLGKPLLPKNPQMKAVDLMVYDMVGRHKHN